GYVRMTAGAATSVLLAIVMATSPARAGTAVARETMPHVEARALPAGNMDFTPVLAGSLGLGLAAAVLVGRRRASRRDAIDPVA
ncbi:MAG TPA: hypothetical protein VF395_20210, partial [Polyangiaceae bacterium]